MNINELEGEALDAAVALAEGWRRVGNAWERRLPSGVGGAALLTPERWPWPWSSSWAFGGEIIERERIAIAWAPEAYRRHGITGPSSGWEASIAAPTDESKDWRLFAYAETPLVAAMRAFVASSK